MMTKDEVERGAALGPDLRAHIGRKLRAYYDQLAAEPVPDRFKTLLEQLERKERDEDPEPETKS